MNHSTPQTLFPTRDSIPQVLAEAAQKLPITNFNELFSLLMVYHNTLLHTLASEPQDKGWRKHDGLGIPLDLCLDAHVEMRLRNGTIERGRAGSRCWKYFDQSPEDILEYRLSDSLESAGGGV